MSHEVDVVSMVPGLHARRVPDRRLQLGRARGHHEGLRRRQQAGQEDDGRQRRDLVVCEHGALAEDGEEAGDVELELRDVGEAEAREVREAERRGEEPCLVAEEGGHGSAQCWRSGEVGLWDISM
jgi:hypothetical protein